MVQARDFNPGGQGDVQVVITTVEWVESSKSTGLRKLPGVLRYDV
jgi:hypothetical protein